jgi:hypothetical protein
MPPRPPTPRKESLVELFDAARRRLIRETGDIALLPNKRIVGATKELNSIVDDIRGAQLSPKARPVARGKEPTLLVSTVGKILRWSKPYR